MYLSPQFMAKNDHLNKYKEILERNIDSTNTNFVKLLKN
jgi:hypothetical protein